MRPADLLVHGIDRTALYPRPFRGRGTPVDWTVDERANMSVAAFQGRIIWVGPESEVFAHVRPASDCQFMSGRGFVAVPGFVDPHTHLVYAGDRSDEFERRVQGVPYIEILAVGGGILKTVKAVRAAGEDELYAMAWQRLQRLIEWGTTTVEIKSGYGLDLENELKMLRVIRRLQQTAPIEVVPTFMGAHAIPMDWRDRADAFVDEICTRWIPRVGEERLAEFNDVFCEKKAFSLEQSAKILAAGRDHGLAPKIHADEIEVIGGVEIAVQQGAVSADHLLMTEQMGITRLAGSGVIPTLLPGTSTCLMHTHHARAREMIAAGLPVAVASDYNPGSCQFFAAPLVQSLAMLQLKMSAAEALIAGTLHAAHALARGDETGAIEVGRRCDLLLLDVPSYKDIGYRVGWNPVHTVIARGKVVHRRGKQ